MRSTISCEEPHEVVRRLYTLVSGPAHEARSWDDVRALFFPDAVLRSELTLPDGSYQSGAWTVDQFCEVAADEYAATGFWEQEVTARVECFENIAHMWTTYESRVRSPDSEPVVRGINSVQLLRREGTWRITSLVFQIDRGTSGIPDSDLRHRTSGTPPSAG